MSGCTGYRLPTEAEWEYAARAGTTTSWSFGEDPADLGDYAWYSSNAGRKVQTVGTRRANRWGLYDLYGNVWELMWDGFSDDYSIYQVVISGGALRVHRGGSFANSPGALRSAERSWNLPEDRSRYVGFRCARGSGPQR